MTALLIMRCRAGPCHCDFLHKSCSKMFKVQVYAIPPHLPPSCKCRHGQGFRGCLKTEGRMRKATLVLQPRETFLVRKSQMESCSQAIESERYETRPAVALLLLSFDAEFAAIVLTGVIVGASQVLDPPVSQSLGARPADFFQVLRIGPVFIVLVQRMTIVAGWKLRTWVRLVWRHYPGGKHFPKPKPKFVSLTAKLGLLWVNKQVVQTFYCQHLKNEHRLGGQGVLSTSRRTFVGCMRGLLNR